MFILFIVHQNYFVLMQYFLSCRSSRKCAFHKAKFNYDGRNIITIPKELFFFIFSSTFCRKKVKLLP